MFDEEEIRWLIFARQVRNASLPIEVLVNYLNLFQKGEQTISKRNQLLADHTNRTKDRTKFEEI